MRVSSLLYTGMGTQRFTFKIHATSGNFCLVDCECGRKEREHLVAPVVTVPLKVVRASESEMQTKV